MTSHRSYGRTKIPPSVIAKKKGKGMEGGTMFWTFLFYFFFLLRRDVRDEGKCHPRVPVCTYDRLAGLRVGGTTKVFIYIACHFARYDRFFFFFFFHLKFFFFLRDIAVPALHGHTTRKLVAVVVFFKCFFFFLRPFFLLLLLLFCKQP